MTGVLRVGLAILAAAAFMIGIWNQFILEHFSAHFPGVSLTPPFAEHDARDYGGATLGTAIVLTPAALVRWRGERRAASGDRRVVPMEA